MSGVISFSTGISAETYTIIEKGYVVIFDHVHTNHGEGYDTFTGCFTAPDEGVYAIFVEVSVEKKDDMKLELVHDNQHLGEIIVEATIGKIATVSKNWVLNLKKGSQLQVKGLKTGDVRGKLQTTFSGWKINGGSGVGSSTDERY